MTDKGKLRELNQRIDEILYYVWDPIGVADNPCARGEYSSYTMTILKYVLKGDINQIADQLSNIEIGSIGLTTKKEHKINVAQRLLDFKLAVEDGLK